MLYAISLFIVILITWYYTHIKNVQKQFVPTIRLNRVWHYFIFFPSSSTCEKGAEGILLPNVKWVSLQLGKLKFFRKNGLTVAHKKTSIMAECGATISNFVPGYYCVFGPLFSGLLRFWFSFCSLKATFQIFLMSLWNIFWNMKRKRYEFSFSSCCLFLAQRSERGKNELGGVKVQFWRWFISCATAWQTPSLCLMLSRWNSRERVELRLVRSQVEAIKKESWRVPCVGWLNERNLLKSWRNKLHFIRRWCIKDISCTELDSWSNQLRGSLRGVNLWVE